MIIFLTDGKLLPTPILFTLRSIAKENDFIPASRDLFVGCVRTMAVSQKKVRLLYYFSIIHSFVCSETILFYSEFNPCLELMTALINILYIEESIFTLFTVWSLPLFRINPVWCVICFVFCWNLTYYCYKV